MIALKIRSFGEEVGYQHEKIVNKPEMVNCVLNQRIKFYYQNKHVIQNKLVNTQIQS